jgi:hypothetical protein
LLVVFWRTTMFFGPALALETGASGDEFDAGMIGSSA